MLMGIFVSSFICSFTPSETCKDVDRNGTISFNGRSYAVTSLSKRSHALDQNSPDCGNTFLIGRMFSGILTQIVQDR